MTENTNLKLVCEYIKHTTNIITDTVVGQFHKQHGNSNFLFVAFFNNHINKVHILDELLVFITKYQNPSITQNTHNRIKEYIHFVGYVEPTAS